MCRVLKQRSRSCFEKLSSCFCRERDEITHLKRKWGFFEGLFLKEGRRNCRAELLLLVRVVIRPPSICSWISSTFWLLHESEMHTDLDQVCLIWFEERGVHLQFQFGHFLKLCHKTRLRQLLFLSWKGLQHISSRSKKFSVQGEESFSFEG